MSFLSAPSRRILPVKLYRTGDRMSVDFSATEIGEHLIDIRIHDQRVVGAPFR